MRLFLAIALTLASLTALAAGKGRITSTVNGWFACDTAGKLITTTYQATGTLVSQPFPNRSDRLRGVAFLVTESPAVISALSGTLTATFRIDASTPCFWRAGYTGPCTTPPNFRFYFTTRTGTYSLTDGEHHPEQYWWSSQVSATCAEVDDGLTYTLTVPLVAEQFSYAMGGLGANMPEAFYAALANARQVGFSFGGGCFYDTGVGVADGSEATLHVMSFE